MVRNEQEKIFDVLMLTIALIGIVWMLWDIKNKNDNDPFE